MNLVVTVAVADAVNRAGAHALGVSRVEGLQMGVGQRVDCGRLDARKHRPRSPALRDRAARHLRALILFAGECSGAQASPSRAVAVRRIRARGGEFRMMNSIRGTGVVTQVTVVI